MPWLFLCKAPRSPSQAWGLQETDGSPPQLSPKGHGEGWDAGIAWSAAGSSWQLPGSALPVSARQRLSHGLASGAERAAPFRGLRSQSSHEQPLQHPLRRLPPRRRRFAA